MSKINQDLSRFESHTATMTRLFINMLDHMSEQVLKDVVAIAIEEAVEVWNAEHEEQ